MLESIAFLSLAALALAALARFLRLPSLLGMLLAGFLLGPHCLNVLSPSLLSISAELRKIALLVILMRAGLALNLGLLRKVGRSAVLMSFIPACFEIAAFVVLAPLLLGVSYVDAALMGCVVAAVSPAVIVPSMLKLADEGVGCKKSVPQMIMAAASIDDMFVIVLFSLFLSFGLGGEFEFSQLLTIPVSLVLGLVIGWILGCLAVWFFKRFHLRDTVKLIILLSVSFLLLAVEEYAPFSALLAVMAMGASLLLKYEVLARRLSSKFSKLWVFAEILLFVLVGAAVDVSYAFEAGFAALALLGIALICRSLGVFLSLVFSPLNFRERMFCAIAFLPKATVQAAIGSVPLAAGLGCGELVLSIAVLSILLTAPLGALGIDLSAKRLL